MKKVTLPLHHSNYGACNEFTFFLFSFGVVGAVLMFSFRIDCIAWAALINLVFPVIVSKKSFVMLHRKCTVPYTAVPLECSYFVDTLRFRKETGNRIFTKCDVFPKKVLGRDVMSTIAARSSVLHKVFVLYFVTCCAALPKLLRSANRFLVIGIPRILYAIFEWSSRFSLRHLYAPFSGSRFNVSFFSLSLP